jgi:uncharacterized protein YjbJ (UPF0337 family)
MGHGRIERLPTTRGGNTMGLGDKIDNAAEKAGGKADQAKGDLKQAGEKVKDAFKKD